MAESTITEEQMVSLVRKALLVAGKEMGEEGDHWPVVKAAIHGIMRDWEYLKIERNVHEELRVHVYAQLDEMDKILLTCPEDVRVDAEPNLKQLREIYDAYFASVDEGKISLSAEDLPAHVKSAQAIIMTLEGSNGD